MRLVILGPPASGKGTQAMRVARRTGLPHLSTGAMLRDEVERGSETGRAVEATLARGDLVDDDTVYAVLARLLDEAPDGWVLDGFPRTVGQAGSLDARPDGSVDAVIALDVSQPELARRVRGRARREGRDDDSDETLGRRLAVYEENTRPLLAHYGQLGVLKRVDGSRSPDRVTQSILRALDRA
ncbi:MAG: adenylate kinase [Actinomycetes bacterium]